MFAEEIVEAVAGRTLLERLERDWSAALCRKDLGRLESLAHEEFLLIGTRARRPFMMNRQEWLQAVRQHIVEHVAVDVRDAILLDNVIIGTVDAHWRIKSLGRLIEDTVVMTSIWVKDEGGWRAIRRHSTPAGLTNVRA